MIVSHYFVRVYYSRAAKHCERQWQKDHWKAKDAERSKQTPSRLHCTPSDGQENIAGNHLTTIDISYCATWKQRNRYENSLGLGLNDSPHPGLMRERDDFPENHS